MRLISIAVVNTWPLVVAQVTSVLATLPALASHGRLPSAGPRPCSRDSLTIRGSYRRFRLPTRDRLDIPHGTHPIFQILQILLLLQEVLAHLLLLHGQFLQTILPTVSLSF
jgi:hypothetical protein